MEKDVEHRVPQDESGWETVPHGSEESGPPDLTGPCEVGDELADDLAPYPLPAAAPAATPANELERPLRIGAGPRRRRKGRRLVKQEEAGRVEYTPEQRLLLLDVWQRSGLPSKDFGALIGLSKQTLLGWKQKFERFGPAGLMSQPRGGPRGSRLPELTRRTILMIKEQNPDYGCQRISDLLLRGPALPASPGAVGTVLKEAGYVLEEETTRPHPDKVRRFERARPNQLWQTDLFTFTLKRQNRRVHLVAFMDDHSRFITGYGLYASASTTLVLETLRAAIASYGRPEEILTDNGPQYVTWRGVSAFHKELVSQGIAHVVAKPKRPQTLGKVERFWGSLWRECVERAVFLDVEDARRRVGLYIDGYNFHRPHQGIGSLCPADRFFGAAAEVLRTLRARVAANALELARDGLPRKPFYMTGQVGGQSFSVHAAGERVFLTKDSAGREEIELCGPPTDGSPATLPAAVTPESGLGGADEAGREAPAAPGVSAVDELASGSSASSDEEASDE